MVIRNPIYISQYVWFVLLFVIIIFIRMHLYVRGYVCLAVKLYEQPHPLLLPSNVGVKFHSILSSFIDHPHDNAFRDITIIMIMLLVFFGVFLVFLVYKRVCMGDIRLA